MTEHPDDDALLGYLSDSQLLDQGEGIEAHLNNCPDCERRLEALSRVPEFLKTNSVRPWPANADYEVFGELGRGSYAVVHRARDRRLGREVALKVMALGHLSSPESLARFFAEARATAQLNHPGIVKIHEVGSLEGVPFLALEYVTGGSLDKKLRDGALPAREAAELVEKLAHAVAAAHAAGIIHRDLKPANVLLHADGSPRLTDFGVAKCADWRVATATGQILGTAGYMAPEQAEAKKDVGPAADVYGLGAVLYHCLTGVPPFRAENATTTLLEVIEREPIAPSLLLASVPRDLETICLKCLEKDPGRRYISATALGDDLHRFLDGKPVSARPVGPARRLWLWSCRRKALASLAAALVVTFLVGAVASIGFGLHAHRAQREAEGRENDLRMVLAEVVPYLANLSHAQLSSRRGFPVELLEKAEAICEERLSLYPEDVVASDALAHITTALATRDYYHRDYARALTRLGRSKDIWESNCATNRDKPEARRGLAVAYRFTGLCLSAVQEDREPVLAAFQRSAALRAEIAAENADDLVSRIEHISIRSEVAGILREMMQFDQALRVFESITLEADTLTRSFPGNIEGWRSLVWGQLLIADCHAHKQDLLTARHCREKAYHLARSMPISLLVSPDGQGLLGEAARTLVMSKDDPHYTEAITALEAACRGVDAQLQVDPKNMRLEAIQRRFQLSLDQCREAARTPPSVVETIPPPTPLPPPIPHAIATGRGECLHAAHTFIADSFRLRRFGDVTQALALSQAAVSLLDGLMTETPNAIDIGNELSTAWNGTAKCLEKLGRSTEALEALRLSTAAQRRVFETTGNRRILEQRLGFLGEQLSIAGLFDEAAECLRERERLGGDTMELAADWRTTAASLVASGPTTPGLVARRDQYLAEAKRLEACSPGSAR